MLDELSCEGDHGTDGRLIERLGDRAEGTGEAFGDLFGIGSQEDNGAAEFADHAPGDLWASQTIQQVEVDQRQLRSFVLGDGEGTGLVHGAAHDLTAAFPQHQFKLHGEQGLVFDNHDPKVR